MGLCFSYSQQLVSLAQRAVTASQLRPKVIISALQHLENALREKKTPLLGGNLTLMTKQESTACSSRNSNIILREVVEMH